MEEILPKVYLIDNKLAVENPIKGFKPFDEEIIIFNNKEFRVWSPYRSKVAAAILKGLKEFPIKEGTKIIYHGAAHGYTCSFFSSLIGEKGIIYAIEFSERCFNDLLPLCEKYKNIVPVLADSRKTEMFYWIEKADAIYMDIAQPDEVEIFIRNCKEFLKKNGHGMIAIKSRSIDITKSPKEIYKESLKKLEQSGFEIIDWKTLDPYEKAHAIILVNFKKI
ncbi:MAG: fibrillarin-like rRNA/tRNA 2'-O-methyltransferase [Candidatus Aenigmatarchaeota archaeon]